MLIELSVCISDRRRCRRRHWSPSAPISFPYTSTHVSRRQKRLHVSQAQPRVWSSLGAYHRTCGNYISVARVWRQGGHWTQGVWRTEVPQRGPGTEPQWRSGGKVEDIGVPSGSRGVCNPTRTAYSYKKTLRICPNLTTNPGQGRIGTCAPVTMPVDSYEQCKQLVKTFYLWDVDHDA